MALISSPRPKRRRNPNRTLNGNRRLVDETTPAVLEVVPAWRFRKRQPKHRTSKLVSRAIRNGHDNTLAEEKLKNPKVAAFFDRYGHRPKSDLPIEHCQHPSNHTGTWCSRLQAVEITIPDDYKPINRSPYAPDVKRPRARVCRQHYWIIRAHVEGKLTLRGFTHEAQCPICRHDNPTLRDKIMRQWMSYGLSTKSVAIELGVPLSNVYRHIRYFGLDDKRVEKQGRKQALARIVDDGLDAGGATVKDALKALDALRKETDGDTINHKVSGHLGVDLSSMPLEELIGSLERDLADLKRLATLERGSAVAALSAGNDESRQVTIEAHATLVE